ncbi:MAG: hypothetical protein HY687_00425 [Chloroflexi bacterium]|nr:hypothetical protein [Chloroflexota bacterium]
MRREILPASLSILALAALLNLIYWLATGLSPWPYFTFGVATGAAMGFIVLVLSAPRRL